jgi:hypothetical protein
MIGGLIDQINEEGSESNYTKLTTSMLTNMIKEIFNQPQRQVAPIMLYTGMNGMYMTRLMMLGMGIPLVYYSFATYTGKSYYLIVLNLFEKAGLIKAVINTRNGTVEIRKGTEIIKEAFSFDDIGPYLSSLGNKNPKEFYTPKGIRKFIK